MTAAAITNLFPGGPSLAGENNVQAGTGINSGKAEFANLLTTAEMAPAQPEQGVEATPSNTSPLEELFNLLNMLWGYSADETGAESLPSTQETQETIVDSNIEGRESTLTNSQTLSETSDNSATSYGWNNGFISELQMILTMFQQIVTAFETTEQASTVDTSQTATTPTAQGLLATRGLEATTAEQALAENQVETAAMTSLAPGIDVSQITTSEPTEEQATSQQETSLGQPLTQPRFPGDIQGQNPDQSYNTTNNTSTAYQNISSGSPEGLVASPLTAKASTPEQSQPGDVDLHLLSVSFNKDRGVDITDLHYSAPFSGKLTQDLSSREGASLINAPLIDQSDTIKMTKATIKTNDASLDLQTIHISPELLKEHKAIGSTTGSETNITTVTSTNPEDSNVLTIDFNANQDVSQDSSSLLQDTQDASQEILQDTATDDQENTIDSSATRERSITPSSITAIYRDLDGTQSNTGDNNDISELVTTQVREGINQALKMNKNRAVLHLNPPELGSVKVNITVSHNNQVQASFVADHPETRHILEANMQQLKDSLTQNGFSMAQVNVDVSGGFSQWDGTQQDKLTPFGYPTAVLNSNIDDSTEEITTSRSVGIRPDGVHVIA